MSEIDTVQDHPLYRECPRCHQRKFLVPTQPQVMCMDCWKEESHDDN